ncbi:hypothetical protein ACFQ2B_32870 [Streptomyces stramineus]
MLAALMLAGSAGIALTTAAAIGGAGALGLACTRLPAGTEEATEKSAKAEGGPGRLTGPLRSPAMLALTCVMAVCAVPVGLMTLAIPAFVDAHGAHAGTGVVYACWGSAAPSARSGWAAPSHRSRCTGASRASSSPTPPVPACRCWRRPR